MSETNEVGRQHPSFHYPVVKHPTGRVQFRIDRAEVVTIERLGDVHRGQVVSIGPPGKPPTPKALDFARGLVVTGNFSHVAADTPLGVPVLSTEETAPDGPDLGEKIGDFEPARGDETQLQYNPEAPLSVAIDFNADPPQATFATDGVGPVMPTAPQTEIASGGTASTDEFKSRNSFADTPVKKSTKE
jgi:hypothetical protein